MLTLIILSPVQTPHFSAAPVGLTFDTKMPCDNLYEKQCHRPRRNSPISSSNLVVILVGYGTQSSRDAYAEPYARLPDHP